MEPIGGQKFWTYVGIGYGLASLVILALWLSGSKVEATLPILGTKTWQLWNCVLAFLAAYTLFSLRVVRENEVAVKVLLGMPIQDVAAGLTFVPLFVCRLERETSETFQREFPAEPHNIWYGETAPPEGKRPPIRVTTGGDPSPNVSDPVDRRMTLEVSYFVRMRIISMCRFIRVVGDIENAFKQIEDTINPEIQHHFSTRTPRRIIAQFMRINKQLEQRVRRLVAETDETRAWGVAIENLSLKAPDLGKAVNTALRDVPAATLTAQATVAKAHGEAESFKLKETQVAAMRELFLRREGVGLRSQFAALMKALGVTDPAHAIAVLQSVQAIEALKEAGNVTVVGGGVQNLYGLVQALVQSVQPQASATQAPQTPPVLPAPTTPPQQP